MTDDKSLRPQTLAEAIASIPEDLPNDQWADRLIAVAIYGVRGFVPAESAADGPDVLTKVQSLLKDLEAENARRLARREAELAVLEAAEPPSDPSRLH